MPQQLPPQGKPGASPPKPPVPQPPKTDLSAFDKVGRGYITKQEFAKEIMKTPSVYPGKIYSKADKMKIVDDLTRKYPNIKKTDIPFIKKELERGLFDPDIKKREENRQVLGMLKKIFEGK